jgi:hypothetical protein
MKLTDRITLQVIWSSLRIELNNHRKINFTNYIKVI